MKAGNVRPLLRVARTYFTETADLIAEANPPRKTTSARALLLTRLSGSSFSVLLYLNRIFRPCPARSSGARAAFLQPARRPLGSGRSRSRSGARPAHGGAALHAPRRRRRARRGRVAGSALRGCPPVLTARRRSRRSPRPRAPARS